MNKRIIKGTMKIYRNKMLRSSMSSLIQDLLSAQIVLRRSLKYSALIGIYARYMKTLNAKQ